MSNVNTPRLLNVGSILCMRVSLYITKRPAYIKWNKCMNHDYIVIHIKPSKHGSYICSSTATSWLWYTCQCDDWQVKGHWGKCTWIYFWPHSIVCSELYTIAHYHIDKDVDASLKMNRQWIQWPWEMWLWYWISDFLTYMKGTYFGALVQVTSRF